MFLLMFIYYVDICIYIYMYGLFVVTAVGAK